MAENKEKKDEAEQMARHLVNTLFGEYQEPTSQQKRQAFLEEALPSYLFRQEEDQPVLPLTQQKHYRPKSIVQKNVSALLPFLDELSLFEKQWGFDKKDETRAEWCFRMQESATIGLGNLVEACKETGALLPRSIYAYFYAAADEETVSFYQENKKDVFMKIDFPRMANGISLADKFHSVQSGQFSSVAAMAVTMGRNASDTAKKWLQNGEEENYRYLHGFALEMLKAMAAYTAFEITKEGSCVGDMYYLGAAKEGSAKVQSALVKALDASAIEVSFSRNYFMMPEYSALALVLPR